MTVRRTIRTAKVVIETTGLSQAEHDRRVAWSEKNVVNASANMLDVFVYVVVYDEHGKAIRFAGSGTTPSPETQEILESLVSPDDDPTQKAGPA